MLRSSASRLSCIFKRAINPAICNSHRNMSSKQEEMYADDFDTRYEKYFNNKDIDGWQIRQGINDLVGHDMVPEPKVLIAALHACRRVNDFALTVRILESMKDKCGGRVKEIYPYLLQEIRPTLDELGINTPEELGYDKPELFLESVDDLH